MLCPFEFHARHYTRHVKKATAPAVVVASVVDSRCRSTSWCPLRKPPGEWGKVGWRSVVMGVNLPPVYQLLVNTACNFSVLESILSR